MLENAFFPEVFCLTNKGQMFEVIRVDPIWKAHVKLSLQALPFTLLSALNAHEKNEFQEILSMWAPPDNPFSSHLHKIIDVWAHTREGSQTLWGPLKGSFL